MAKEVKDKKRKASAPAADAEKVKKVRKAASEATEALVKKRKATEGPFPAAVKKSKTPGSSTALAVPTAAAKDAPATKATKITNETTNGTKNGTSKIKKTKIDDSDHSASRAQDPRSVERIPDDVSDVESDSSVDDQTQALLKGFESSGDEEDVQKEGGLREGQNVPKIPTMNNKSKKQLLRLQSKEEAEKPGVVYIGHIPHGFYEHEMRAYFTQFGNILKLRLSRNKKTGASKHYAWIQFESATVADIVARTMDSYLLFNHILKVKVVPDEQIPKDLFKGANKRFKKVPWNKIEGRKLAQPASEEVWDKRVTKEAQRREEKKEKLKEIGYEFEAPAIRSAKGVAKKKEVAAVEGGDAQDASKAIEAAPATEALESVSKKKGKKAKSTKLDGINVEEAKTADGDTNIEPPATDEVEKPTDKKSKKERKAKAALEPESTTPAVDTEEKPKDKKAKKEKKGKEVAASVLDDEPEVPKEKKEKKKRKVEDGDDAVEVPLEKKKVKKDKREKPGA